MTSNTETMSSQMLVSLRFLPPPTLLEDGRLPERVPKLEVQFEDSNEQQWVELFQPFHAPTVLVGKRFVLRIDETQTFALESTTTTALLLCWGRLSERSWECVIVGPSRQVQPMTSTVRRILEDEGQAVHKWLQSISLPRESDTVR